MIYKSLPVTETWLCCVVLLKDFGLTKTKTKTKTIQCGLSSKIYKSLPVTETWLCCVVLLKDFGLTKTKPKNQKTFDVD
jgi:hypothetical protein